MKKRVIYGSVLSLMALSPCMSTFADDLDFVMKNNIQDEIDYDLYEPVIKQLEEAFSADKDHYLSNLNNSTFEEMYPFATAYLLKQYYLNNENVGYTLYDINGDGQSELLIGSIWEDEFNDIRDIITFDGENYQSLFTDDWPGYLGHIEVWQNGVISSSNHIGEYIWENCYYKIASNGYDLELIDRYTVDSGSSLEAPYYNESGFYTTEEVYAKLDILGSYIDPDWYYLGQIRNDYYYTDYSVYENIVGVWTAADNTDHWEFYAPNDYYKYQDGIQLEKRGKFLYYKVSNFCEYKGWYFVDDMGNVYVNYSGDDFKKSSLLQWSYDSGYLTIDETPYSRVSDYIVNGIVGSYWDNGEGYYLFKTTGDMEYGENDPHSWPITGEYYCWSDHSVLINKTSGLNNLIMEFDYFEDRLELDGGTYWRQEYPYSID